MLTKQPATFSAGASAKDAAHLGHTGPRPRPVAASAGHPGHPVPQRALGSSAAASTTASSSTLRKRGGDSSVCAAAINAEDAPQEKKTVLTIPTILTLGRLVAIPALIYCFYLPAAWAGPVCTAIFVAAAITDYLDGYLARAWDCSTPFGAFLDPVADKLMVSTSLILIATRPFACGPLTGNAWLMPVLTTLIIGREISMSALREWAAALGDAAHKAVAVNSIGKWKTATQMTALALLLYCRDGGAGTFMAMCGVAGPALMLVATFLTVYSLAVYLKNLWKFMV